MSVLLGFSLMGRAVSLVTSVHEKSNLLQPSALLSRSGVVMFKLCTMEEAVHQLQLPVAASTAYEARATDPRRILW